MILLEFSEIPDRLPEYDELQLIRGRNIIVYIHKNCVDEWIYDADCSARIFNKARQNYISILINIIESYTSRGLLTAALTPEIPSEELAISLEKPDPRAFIKKLYIAFFSNIYKTESLGKYIITMLTIKELLLDTSLPVESKLKVRIFDNIEEILGRSFFVQKDFLGYPNSLIIVKKSIKNEFDAVMSKRNLLSKSS